MIFNDNGISTIDYGVLKSLIGFEGLNINLDSNGKVEEEVCFNATNLLSLLSRLLYGFNAEQLAEMLDITGGFEQSDGTYALYQNTYKRIKSLQDVPWEELDDASQAKYVQSAKIFLWAIIDKFIEGNR